MNDKSIAAAEAQQEIAGQKQYAGGNAMLNARAEVESQTNDPAIEQPAATNYSENKETDDPTEAKQFTTTGNYPVDFERLEEEGNLSMTKDVPSSE